MAQKKKRGERLEDIYYPIPQDYCPVQVDKPVKPHTNRTVIRRFTQDALRVAFKLQNPRAWDYDGKPIKPKQVADKDQIEMFTHLVESLEPRDTIECALACQFAVSYIRGMDVSDGYSGPSFNIEFFQFGHEVLECLQRYRSKGAQQIQVNYNHNEGGIHINKGKQEESIDLEVEANG